MERGDPEDHEGGGIIRRGRRMELGEFEVAYSLPGGNKLRLSKLAVVESRVDPAVGKKLVMLTLLDDLPILHHADQVSATDGAQAVGDHHGSAPTQEDTQGLLDQALGEAVDVGGGLV